VCRQNLIGAPGAKTSLQGSSETPMFTIKTYNPQAREKMKFGFYVLNKGMNAGKPHYEPFRNSFAIMCNDLNEQTKLYWACKALHLNGRFRPHLHGTAVQTICIDDVHKVLAEAYYRVNGKAGLLQTIKHVNTLEELARVTDQKRSLIKEAQGALLAEFFIR